MTAQSASVSGSGSTPLSMSSPATIASILGIAIGAAMVVAGFFFMFGNSTSMTLNVSIVVIGLVEGAVSYYTLRASRVAWAFALSTNGTACTVLLFSAPRIRDATEVNLGLALIPCVLFGFILTLFAVEPKEF